MAETDSHAAAILSDSRRESRAVGASGGQRKPSPAPQRTSGKPFVSTHLTRMEEILERLKHTYR